MKKFILPADDKYSYGPTTCLSEFSMQQDFYKLIVMRGRYEMGWYTCIVRMADFVI